MELSRSADREMSAHLAGLAAARLPLAPGLRALAEELGDRRLGKALRKAAERVEAGAAPDDALGPDGAGLPPPLRELLLAGAASDRLVEVIAQQVAATDIDADLKRRTAITLIYPAILIFAVAALYGIVGSYILARFEEIFADFGVDLPALTIMLIQVGAFVREYGLRILLALVGFVIIGTLVWNMGLQPITRQRIRRGLPLIGSLWGWLAQARLARALAMLIEVGTPLPRALKLGGQLARDADIAAICHDVAREVEAGRSLSESLATRPWLDPILTLMIAWCEGRQEVVAGLRTAAETLEAMARSQVRFAGAVIAVLTFLVVAPAIALALFALLLPMLDLISKLSGTVVPGSWWLTVAWGGLQSW